MRAFHEIREYTSGLEVWHGRYDNIGIIAHWHGEMELVHVRRGSCVLHVNSRRIAAKEGDLAVIRSGEIHYCDEHSDDLKLEFLIFSPDALKSSMRGLTPASGRIPAERMRQTGFDRDWTDLIARMDEELSEKGPYYLECTRLMLTALYCRLLRLAGREDGGEGGDEAEDGFSRGAAGRFPEVLSYMEEHCGENLSLSETAAYAGISESYLSKIFSRYAGMGFVEYLNLLRISRASELLQESGRKVIDVAGECGFGNIRSFNRVFLRYTGRTPSAYRRDPGADRELFLPLRSYSQYTTNEQVNPTVRRQCASHPHLI